MGLSASKLRQQHMTKLHAEMERQFEEEENEKKKINSNFTKTLMDRRKKIDSELAAESEMSLKNIDNQMAELREIKRNNESTLKSLEQSYREKIKKEISEREAADKKMMENQQKECQEKRDKLETLTTKLNTKRAELIEIVKQEHETRKAMQEEYNKMDDESRKNHEKAVQQANEEFQQFRLENQGKMKELLEINRKLQQDLHDTQRKLLDFKFHSYKAVAQSVADDNSHEDLQSQLTQFRKLFSSFIGAYKPQELVLLMAIRNMGNKKELKNIPQSQFVLAAFEPFEAKCFNLRLSADCVLLNASLKKIIEKIEELTQCFVEIEGPIHDYREAWNEKPENYVDIFEKCHKDIKKNTETLQELIKALSSQMMEFHIPSENHVQTAINHMHSGVANGRYLENTKVPSGNNKGQLRD